MTTNARNGDYVDAGGLRTYYEVSGEGRPARSAARREQGIGVLPPFLRDLYAAVSPDGPEHFETVFEKLSPVWLSDDELELADLKTMQAPTLIMAGEQDMLTAEHAAEMRDALPDGQLEIVAGTSHGLPMEKPDITSRLVLEFLDG